MERDEAIQTTDYDKEFIRIYKLIHLANERAAYTASKTLNGRLSERDIKDYIKNINKLFIKMSETIKKYRDNIAKVDRGVVLNDHTTYPTYFNLLSSENKRKVNAFELSIDKFEDSYKMVRELNELNKSPSPRSPRTPPSRSTRSRVGGKRKRRETRKRYSYFSVQPLKKLKKK